MKTNIQFTTALVFAVCSFIGLAGCASSDSSDAPNQKSLLSAAGFHVRKPETAQQKELYDAVPSYQFQRAAVNGKVFYTYKIEQQGVAYVGGQEEYRRYQRFASHRRIAPEYYAAAQMNDQAALGWYSAWGPGPFWP